MSVRDEWNAIADKLNNPPSWQEQATAAGWIDPQRIVDLAKRYTDEGKPGWVELHFHDRAAEWAKPWYVITPGDARSSMHEGDTATDALKEAEA